MKRLLITGAAGKSGLVLAHLIADGGLREPYLLRFALRTSVYGGAQQFGSSFLTRNSAWGI